MNRIFLVFLLLCSASFSWNASGIVYRYACPETAWVLYGKHWLRTKGFTDSHLGLGLMTPQSCDQDPDIPLFHIRIQNPGWAFIALPSGLLKAAEICKAEDCVEVFQWNSTLKAYSGYSPHRPTHARYTLDDLLPDVPVFIQTTRPNVLLGSEGEPFTVEGGASGSLVKEQPFANLKPLEFTQWDQTWPQKNPHDSILEWPLNLGQEFSLEGKISESFLRAEVIVTDPKGAITRLPIQNRIGNSFRLTYDFGLVGVYSFQIEAKDTRNKILESSQLQIRTKDSGSLNIATGFQSLAPRVRTSSLFSIGQTTNSSYISQPNRFAMAQLHHIEISVSASDMQTITTSIAPGRASVILPAVPYGSSRNLKIAYIDHSGEVIRQGSKIFDTTGNSSPIQPEPVDLGIPEITAIPAPGAFLHSLNPTLSVTSGTITYTLDGTDPKTSASAITTSGHLSLNTTSTLHIQAFVTNEASQRGGVFRYSYVLGSSPVVQISPINQVINGRFLDIASLEVYALPVGSKVACSFNAEPDPNLATSSPITITANQSSILRCIGVDTNGFTGTENFLQLEKILIKPITYSFSEPVSANGEFLNPGSITFTSTQTDARLILSSDGSPISTRSLALPFTYSYNQSINLNWSTERMGLSSYPTSLNLTRGFVPRIDLSFSPEPFAPHQFKDSITVSFSSTHSGTLLKLSLNPDESFTTFDLPHSITLNDSAQLTYSALLGNGLSGPVLSYELTKATPAQIIVSSPNLGTDGVLISPYFMTRFTANQPGMVLHYSFDGSIPQSKWVTLPLPASVSSVVFNTATTLFWHVYDSENNLIQGNQLQATHSPSTPLLLDAGFSGLTYHGSTHVVYTSTAVDSVEFFLNSEPVQAKTIQYPDFSSRVHKIENLPAGSSTLNVKAYIQGSLASEQTITLVVPYLYAQNDEDPAGLDARMAGGTQTDYSFDLLPTQISRDSVTGNLYLIQNQTLLSINASGTLSVVSPDFNRPIAYAVHNDEMFYMGDYYGLMYRQNAQDELTDVTVGGDYHDLPKLGYSEVPLRAKRLFFSGEPELDYRGGPLLLSVDGVLFLLDWQQDTIRRLSGAPLPGTDMAQSNVVPPADMNGLNALARLNLPILTVEMIDPDHATVAYLDVENKVILVEKLTLAGVNAGAIESVGSISSLTASVNPMMVSSMPADQMPVTAVQGLILLQDGTYWLDTGGKIWLWDPAQNSLTAKIGANPDGFPNLFSGNTEELAPLPTQGIYSAQDYILIPLHTGSYVEILSFAPSLQQLKLVYSTQRQYEHDHIPLSHGHRLLLPDFYAVHGLKFQAHGKNPDQAVLLEDSSYYYDATSKDPNQAVLPGDSSYYYGEASNLEQSPEGFSYFWPLDSSDFSAGLVLREVKFASLQPQTLSTNLNSFLENLTRLSPDFDLNTLPGLHSQSMSCQQTQDFLAQATKLGMTLKDIYLNPLCYNLDIDFSSRTVYAATLIQGNQIRIYSMDMDSQSPVTLAWFSEAQLMTDFGLLPLSAATPVGKLLVRGNTAWLALELGLLKIDFSQPSVRLVLSTQGLSQQIGAELPDNPIRITNLFQDEAGHIWIENTDPVYGELHLHLLNEEQGITQFLGFTHDALYNPKSYGFHAQPFPGSTILLPFQSRLFQTEEGLWAGAGRDWTRIGLETSPAREDFTTRITLGAPSPTNLAPGSILSVPVSQTETLDILGTAAGIPGQRTTQGLEFPITSHTFMFDEVLRGAVFVDKFGYRSHPFDGIPYGPYLPDLNTILQPPSVESLAIPNLVVRTPYELSNLLRTTGAYNQIEFIQRDEAGKIIAKDSYPSSNLGGSQPEILHGIPEIFHTGSQSLQIDVSGPKGQSTTRVGFNYLSGSQAILGAAGPGLPINFSGLSGDRMVPLSDGSLAVYTRDEALDATNYDFSQPVYVHHPGKPVRRFFLRDPNGNQQIRIHGLAQNSLGEIFVLYGSSPSIIAKLPNLEDYALDSHITPEPFLMIHAEIHEIAFHEGYLVAAGLPASRGFTDPFYGKFVPSISPLADALFVLRFPKNPENDITLAQPVQTNQTLYTNAPSFLKQSGGELFLGVSTASSAHLLRITHPDSENMAFTLLLNWGEVTPNTQTYQVRSFTDISYGSSYLKVIPSPNPTSSFGGGYTYAHSGPVMGVFFNGFDLGSSIMAYNNSEGTYGNPDSANSPHIQEYSSSSLAISQIPGHEVIYRLNSQKALEAIEPGGMVIPLSEAQTSRLDGIRHQSEFRDGLLRIAMTEEPRAGIYFIQESDKGLYFLDLTTRKIHPFPSAFFYQDIVPSPLGGIYALNNKMAIQYLKFDGVWTDVWEDTFGGSLHPPLPDFIRASFDVSSDNRYIYLAQMDKVYIWDLESALNGPSNPPTLPASPTLTEIQIPENLGPNVTLRRSKDRLYYANTDGFSQKIYSVSTNTAESPILIGEGNNQIYRKNLMHRIGDTVYAERISSYQPFEFTLGENGLNLESSSEISSLFDPYQSMYYPSILADSSHNARYNFNHYLRTWAKLGNRVFGIYWDYNKRHSVIRMAYANETAPETSLGASISVSAQQIQTEFGFASEFSLGVSNATTMLSYFTESAQLGQVVTSLVSGGTYNWSRTVRTAEIPHSPLNPNYVSGMSPSGQIKVWELPTTTNAEIANASKALDFKASSTQLVFVTGSHFDATVGTEITSGTDTLIQIQYIDMNQSREIPSRSEGTLLSTTVFNLGMPAYLPEYRTSVSPTTLVTNLPVRLIQDINPTNNTRYHHSFNLSGKTDVCLDPYLLHPSSELLFLNSYPSGVVNESYFCIRLNTTGQNTLDYSIEEESYLTPITQ